MFTPWKLAWHLNAWSTAQHCLCLTRVFCKTYIVRGSIFLIILYQNISLYQVEAVSEFFLDIFIIDHSSVWFSQSPRTPGFSKVCRSLMYWGKINATGLIHSRWLLLFASFNHLSFAQGHTRQICFFSKLLSCCCLWHKFLYSITMSGSGT